MTWMLEAWAYGGSLLAIYLVGHGNRWGFVVGAAGFVPWSLLALIGGLPLMVLFNAAITALNVCGWLRSRT